MKANTSIHTLEYLVYRTHLTALKTRIYKKDNIF